jgi:uncharacterized lipoprotein YddW (UPF0748 family)
MAKVPSRRGFLAGSAAVSAALAGSGLLTGCSSAAAAEAAASAGNPSPGSCAGDPAHPKRQLRGVWIASVSNINWPSAPGLSAAQQQAELTALLDAAVRMRMNAVYLQIRPAADALYDSPYEPWSQYLTGTQGQDPGYDPLAFAVAEAHKRNLELHAWMNPYRVSTQPDPSLLVPTHPARVHPDWCVQYGGQLYYDPGVPAVMDFDVQVITDVAKRYDIDGIHFDDYFYPYPVGTADFPDDPTFAAYGAGFPDKATWRRANVDKLVSTLHRELRAVKPWVKWGISPFGIWRNQATDPSGSATNGLQSYDALSSDTRGWVQKGWLDYIAPQLYWNIGFPPAAYDVLVDWWSKIVDGTGTQLLIGQTVSKIGTSSPPAWLNPDPQPGVSAGGRGHLLQRHEAAHRSPRLRDAADRRSVRIPGARSRDAAPGRPGAAAHGADRSTADGRRHASGMASPAPARSRGRVLRGVPLRRPPAAGRLRLHRRQEPARYDACGFRALQRLDGHHRRGREAVHVLRDGGRSAAPRERAEQSAGGRTVALARGMSRC